MAGPFSCEPNHQSVVASGRRLGGRSDFEIREQTEALIAGGVPRTGLNERHDFAGAATHPAITDDPPGCVPRCGYQLVTFAQWYGI
jgi:hypothetical protein